MGEALTEEHPGQPSSSEIIFQACRPCPDKGGAEKGAEKVSGTKYRYSVPDTFVFSPSEYNDARNIPHAGGRSDFENKLQTPREKIHTTKTGGSIKAAKNKNLKKAALKLLDSGEATKFIKRSKKVIILFFAVFFVSAAVSQAQDLCAPAVGMGEEDVQQLFKDFFAAAEAEDWGRMERIMFGNDLEFPDLQKNPSGLVTKILHKYVEAGVYLPSVLAIWHELHNRFTAKLAAIREEIANLPKEGACPVPSPSPSPSNPIVMPPVMPPDGTPAGNQQCPIGCPPGQGPLDPIFELIRLSIRPYLQLWELLQNEPLPNGSGVPGQPSGKT